MADAIGNLAIILSADTGQAKRGLTAFGKDVDSLDKKVKGLGAASPNMKGIGQVGRKLKGGMGSGFGDPLGLGALVPWATPAAAALAGVAVAGVAVKKSLDLAAEAERNRLAFEAMTGSADKASRVIRQLRKYAEESPYSTSQVMDIGKRLLAYGVEAEQITPSVRALGDVAAATGGDIDLIALAFGQVKTMGRLAGQELNQFAQQGVPLIEELAAVMKKPKEEIKKLVEEGEVGFDQVVAAINRMTSAGGRFAGLQDKYAKSFKGLSDRIGDTADSIGREFGTALIEDFQLKPMLSDAIRVLEAFRPVLADLRPGMKEFGYGLRTGVKLLADMQIATTKMVRLGAAFGKAFFSPELKEASKAWESLKTALGILDATDLQGTFHAGVRLALKELKPLALGVADTIDNVLDGLEALDDVWNGIKGGAEGAFDAIRDGLKLMMAPLDAGIATLKAFQEVIQDPTKLKDLKLDVVIGDTIKKLAEGRAEKPNLKGDFDADAWRKGRERERAREGRVRARQRVEQGFDAADRLNDAMEEARWNDFPLLKNLDRNLGQMFGDNYAKAKDFAGKLVEGNAALKQFGGLVEQGRKLLGFSEDALKASKGIAAALREDAKKLNDQYADPFKVLDKRARELDAMFGAGLISDKIRGLAFDAEVNRLLKDKGDTFRPAPNAEYGSQEFARLVQQAVVGGPKDQLALLKDQLTVQEQIARNGDALLNKFRQLNPPQLQKLPGE